MKTRGMFALTLAFGLTCACLESGNAALINPTLAGGAGVGFSSEFNNREAVHVVDGSGITGTVTVSSVHEGGPGVSPDGIMWHTGSGTTGFLVFDLGEEFDLLRTAYVWQFAEGTGSPNNFDRGVATMNISFSSDPNPLTATFTQIVGPGPGGVFELPIHPAAQVGVFAEVLDLSNTKGARLVRFDILTNHGDPGFVGLSEVRFAGIANVPEPSSSLLLGAGIAGLVLRRGRRG